MSNLRESLHHEIDREDESHSKTLYRGNPHDVSYGALQDRKFNRKVRNYCILAIVAGLIVWAYWPWIALMYETIKGVN